MQECFDKIDFYTLEEVENVVSKMHWQRDGIFELGDAISDPAATYFRHVNGIDGAMDCDEMAIFAATVIKDMAAKGRILDKGIWPDRVFLLSVPWIDEKGKVGGHNICTFYYIDNDTKEYKWAHISNWFGGRIIWNFDTLDDVLKSILITKTSIGYGLVTPDLKLITYGWKANV